MEEKVKKATTKETEVKLNKNVWELPFNGDLIAQVLYVYMNNERKGTSNAKTRGDVSGGGRKPWRQKGTGHARQGSIRAVQWRGGGIAFGPTPRDYSKKMNRKERRLALKSALATKAPDMIIVEELKLATPKTKDMKNLLANLKLDNTKTLIIVKELDENIILASRNLANIALIESGEVNVLDLIAADKILITDEALKSIEEVLG